MALKKGIVLVDDKEVEQYVLESKEDVDNFYEEIDDRHTVKSLKDDFKGYIAKGEKILLNTKLNAALFYSWRTAGKENWILLKLI